MTYEYFCMLHGLTPIHFLASLLLGPNFGQSKFHYNIFLLKSFSFFLFKKKSSNIKAFLLILKTLINCCLFLFGNISNSTESRQS